MPRCLAALACLWFMTSAWAQTTRAAQPVIWLAMADRGGPYAEAAEALRAELPAGQVEAIARPWQELLHGDGPPPRLIVTIGAGALRGMAESGPRVPLLATLLPRSAYATATGAGPARAQSAIWLDQPAGRLIDLVHLALPSRQRVAVVFGPESRAYESELQHATGERGLSLVAVRSDGPDQLPGALQKVLDDADLLLALPDPQIYNGATIQNVLTSAYRRRIPMVGFSPAYVKAGALLALYSTPAQVGAQAGDIARGFLAGRPLPPPQAPREFVIAVNPDVARSLGIVLETGVAEKWAEHLRMKERLP
ncbi:MAG TPA: ABC transporter substrate binding protein [Rhodocyclaceae bacterium]